MMKVENIVETIKQEEEIIKRINETVGTTPEHQNFDMSEEELKVHMTYDYSQFKAIKGNRIINPSNYAKLLASMKEEYIFSPILVNEHKQIIDGQHRFMVCQVLGYPIYYIMKNGYGIKQVKKVNLSGVTWGKPEFLHMYIEEGIEEYKEFNQLIVDHSVSITDLLKVFSIVQKSSLNVLSTSFEEGDLNISGIDRVKDFLTALEDFSFLQGYKSSYFTGAFMKLFFHPNYDHDRMKKRLETRASYLKPQRNIDDYLGILTRDIYSFGAAKNPIFYDSDRKSFYVR